MNDGLIVELIEEATELIEMALELGATVASEIGLDGRTRSVFALYGDGLAVELIEEADALVEMAYLMGD